MTIENSDTRAARPRIVVGVDGSDAALAAVRYAAAEAVRGGAELVIAHAGPSPLVLGAAGPLGLYPLTPAEYRGVGIKIVNHARTVAREVAGDSWPIRTALLDGETAAAALVAHAHGARMLVLGDQRRALLDRLVTGSVLHDVAGNARVPVIVVPEGWQGEDPKAVVTVGIGEIETSEDLLQHAMAIAADRDATLRIVHAWELPGLYDDLIVTRIDSELWRDQNRQEIEAVLRRLRPAFPHLAVDVELVHQQPARALVAASGNADLLVLGRRRRGLRHLGGTARAVLREARCPVEVVPPAQERTRSPESRILDPALVG